MHACPSATVFAAPMIVMLLRALYRVHGHSKSSFQRFRQKPNPFRLLGTTKSKMCRFLVKLGHVLQGLSCLQVYCKMVRLLRLTIWGLLACCPRILWGFIGAPAHAANFLWGIHWRRSENPGMWIQIRMDPHSFYLPDPDPGGEIFQIKTEMQGNW